MDIIDDEGRLFGLVNVIDALVVLLVLAVIVAGAVFILSDPGERDTRYATVDLGEQPGYVIDSVAVGDEMDVEGHADNLTITDVYHGPGDAGHLIVRVELHGERVILDEETDRDRFEWAGEPLRSGEPIEIVTPDYAVEGEVIAFDREGETLPTTQTAVFTRTTVDAATAEAISVGDTYTVNGQPVAEIESLQLYPGDGGEQTALVGLTLETIAIGGVTNYGPSAVRLGADLPFVTDEYNITVSVLERGTAELLTETTEVLVETTMDRVDVDDIDVGDEYRLGDQTIGTIQAVTAYPTADEETAAVLLGIDYVTYEEAGAVMFGDTELRTGTELPFRTGDYVLAGEVVQRGTTALEGDTREVAITSTVDADIVDDIRPGDTYLIGDATPVAVESVEVYPTADRDTKRVILGAEIHTHELRGEVHFGTDVLRLGSTIPMRTADYSLTGTVINKDGLGERGEPVTRTVTVKLENIRPELADRLEVGLTETHRDRTTAEILAIDEAPAEVILESEDGDIFLREHPRNLDVELEVEVLTFETGDTIRFHGDRLLEGDEITLQFPRIAIQGDVIAIED